MGQYPSQPPMHHMGGMGGYPAGYAMGQMPSGAMYPQFGSHLPYQQGMNPMMGYQQPQMMMNPQFGTAAMPGSGMPANFPSAAGSFSAGGGPVFGAMQQWPMMQQQQMQQMQQMQQPGGMVQQPPGGAMQQQQSTGESLPSHAAAAAGQAAVQAGAPTAIAAPLAAVKRARFRLPASSLSLLPPAVVEDGGPCWGAAFSEPVACPAELPALRSGETRLLGCFTVSPLLMLRIRLAHEAWRGCMEAEGGDKSDKDCVSLRPVPHGWPNHKSRPVPAASPLGSALGMLVPLFCLHQVV